MSPWPFLLVLLGLAIYLLSLIPTHILVTIGFGVWAMLGIFLMFEGSLRYQKNPKDRMGIAGVVLTIALLFAMIFYQL